MPRHRPAATRILPALALLLPALLAGCAAPASDWPEPAGGAPRSVAARAERIDPPPENVTVALGAEQAFYAQCLNPDLAVDGGEWWVRRPGAEAAERVVEDEPQAQIHPWGPRAHRVAFDAVGDWRVEWACLDGEGERDAVGWNVTVAEPSEPSAG